MLMYLSGGSRMGIDDIVIVSIIMIFAFILHNVAIAWMASRYGDDNPRYAGFLSFEPQRHLNAWGLGLFLLLGFGWPTDVNVNSRHYRGRGRAEALVWYTGPLTYFAIALVCTILNAFLFAGGNFSLSLAASVATLHGVINIFPIFPLDGAKAALAFGNPQMNNFIRQMESYGNIGFIVFFMVMSYSGITTILMSIFMSFFNVVAAILTGSSS